MKRWPVTPGHALGLLGKKLNVIASATANKPMRVIEIRRKKTRIKQKIPIPSADLIQVIDEVESEFKRMPNGAVTVHQRWAANLPNVSKRGFAASLQAGEHRKLHLSRPGTLRHIKLASDGNARFCCDENGRAFKSTIAQKICEPGNARSHQRGCKTIHDLFTRKLPNVKNLCNRLILLVVPTGFEPVLPT